MAFNFNWSPLIADSERVRDMLTNALNRSPKPPIIVDDIIVNELNLGSTPPELEILEIGDLAEDRFRGIFKMSYTGDAYLTLKTRVQANPLHTSLSTRPAFTSPQPLAANSSLTIPIQITLSEFRLSGFVILVFSKQKGITIVFRNDPLETLKVSSTFDSIPFVRDFLQKTIENQLRVLFVEDLPAIIHRLSLRVFSPEHQPLEEHESKRLQGEVAHHRDAFSGADFLDGDGGSPDSPTETYTSFSQKSLLRLAALSESQRTLSLFTPSIRDTVYRAWARAATREEVLSQANTPTIRPVTLSRLQSQIAPSALSSAASQTSDGASQVTRPTLASMSSAATVYSLGTGAPRSRPGKKRKNRVVNLRKPRGDGDVSDTMSIASSYDESASRSMTGSAESSARKASTGPTTTASEPREGEINTPPRSPLAAVVTRAEDTSHHKTIRAARPKTPTRGLHVPAQLAEDLDPTPRASVILPTKPASRPAINQLRHMQPFPSRSPSPELRRTSSDLTGISHTSSTDRKLQGLLSVLSETSGGGILEQAWMQKMASEIAKKVAEEKDQSRHPRPWRMGSFDAASTAGAADAPPPAYGL